MSDSSLGLLKSALVVSVSAAATLSVFGVYWTVQRAASETKTRRAKYTCSCGNVEASIIIPAANYRYSEIPSFQCACHNCVHFCDKVLASGSAKLELDNFCSPGAPYIVLYDSEIQMVKGHEYLKSMKLSSNTSYRRIYSTCCGTPMSVSLDKTCVNLIYTPNLKEEEVLMEMEIDLSPIPPTAVFYSSQAIPTKPSAFTGTRTRRGTFDSNTILHCISRLTMLFFLGEKGPGHGFPIIGQVQIGIDTIQKNK